MSSPENSQSSEDEERNESPTARGDSAASSSAGGGKNTRQPGQQAADKRSSAELGDEDFIPKISEVRSRHGDADDQAATMILPGEPEMPVDPERAAAALSAAAFAIEMTAVTSLNDLPVTTVSPGAQSFADIAMPEVKAELSTSHLNPEFGYHGGVSEPKDGPRQPPSPLPPPPKSVTQYQHQLSDPSTSHVDSLIHQSGDLDEIWALHDERAGNETRRASGAGSSKADGTEAHMLFAPQGYGAASMTPLSPQQVSLELPSAIDEEETEDAIRGETAQQRKERSALVRRSLYWVVKEARLVTHGVFADYEPPRKGDPKSSGTFSAAPPAQPAAAPTAAWPEPAGEPPFVTASNNPPPAMPNPQYGTAAPAVNNIPPQAPPTMVLDSLPPEPAPPAMASKIAPPDAVRDQLPRGVSKDVAASEQFPQPMPRDQHPGAPADGSASAPAPREHVSPFASRDQAPRAVPGGQPPGPQLGQQGDQSPPRAQGQPPSIVPAPSEPMMSQLDAYNKPPSSAQNLLSEASLKSVGDQTPPAKVRAVPPVAGPESVASPSDDGSTVLVPTQSKVPGEPAEPPARQGQSEAGGKPGIAISHRPGTLSPVDPALADQRTTDQRKKDLATTADPVNPQEVTAERPKDQRAIPARFNKDQRTTAERYRDQRVTSERAMDLEQKTTGQISAEQRTTDQRKTDQRTTREGTIKLPLIGVVKKEDVKKQVITLVSVVALCVASAVVMYDTIRSNRDGEVKPSPNLQEPDETPDKIAEKTAPDETRVGTETDSKAVAPSKTDDTAADLAEAFKLEQKFNYIDSMNLFDKVIKRDGGKNPKSLHGRGRVLTKLQLYDRALEDLEEADRLDPKNINVLIDLAAVKYLLADYGNAAKDYELILADHPKDVDALYGRGISLAGMGKNQEAIADFQAVVKLKPAYDKAYRQMCTAYLALNQADKAESSITTAMKACGADADLYFSRALSRYQMGRKETSLEDYNEAIHLSPDRKEYYNDRGFVMMDLGRLDDARKDFEKALEIDPKYKLAADNLKRLRKAEKAKSQK
jgi:tetratricopeptide (TPR) repeat protein